MKKSNDKITPSTVVTRHIVWISVFIVLAIICFVRMRFLDIPLERDEGEYAYVGQLLLGGIPPYAEAYSMKMPGIYAVYAVIMSVFGRNVEGIHMALIVVNIVTAGLIFFVGKRLFGIVAGLIASGNFVILAAGYEVQGIWANSEHFILPLAMGGVLLLLRAIESDDMRSLFFSGILLGGAFVIKQHAAVFILFAALYYLIERGWRNSLAGARRTVWGISVLGCGILLPFLVTVLLLLKAGVFNNFWFWTFTYAGKYISHNPFDAAFLFKLTRDIAGSAALVWGRAVLGLFLVAWDRRFRRARTFAYLFFAFSFMAVLPGFFFRRHYYVLLLPAVALMGGAGVMSAAEFLTSAYSTRAKNMILVILMLGVFSSSIYQQKDFFFRMTPETATRNRYDFNPFPESVEIAEYIKEHTREGDNIAVIGSEPQIYFYADRKSSTRYIYTYPLMESHDFALKMQEDMIREIESSAPAFLVFVHVYTSWLVQPASETMIFEWFERYSREHYDKIGVVDIKSLVYTDYVWGNEAEDYAPVSARWISIYERKGRSGTISTTAGNAKSAGDLGEAMSLNRKGVEVAKTGNLDSAIGIFEEASGICPGYAETYNNLGYAYFKKGDLDLAEKYFAEAVKVDPAHEKAAENLELLRRSKD